MKVENPSPDALDAKVLVSDETAKPITPATGIKLAPGGETLVRFPLTSPAPPATTTATQPAPPVQHHYVVKVLDPAGTEILSEGPIRFVAVNLQPENLVLVAGGDANVTSEQSLAAAQPPDGPPAPGAASLQINYSFAAGWKYVCLKLKTPELQKIEGKPVALGIWVHGDGTGNIPRMRIVDSTKQTFQPDGPAMKWKDWKYIVFPLDGTHAGQWGGAGTE